MSTAQKDKLKAIDGALSQIERQFGKGSIMRLGQTGRARRSRRSPPARSPSTPPSASAASRAAASSRSTAPSPRARRRWRSHVVAQAQRLGGVAAFIDAEHALDAEYAGKLGVDIDNLLVSQPDSGEQALEIAEMLVRSNAVDVVVIDSVAALVPRAEIEGEMGDSHVGLQARLMSQALRKLTAIVAKSKTCLIFINQIREKIGVMFGSPETTTGGRALKFYSSVRIDIRRIGTIKDGDVVVGTRAQGQGRQEQGRAAVPHRRVRHRLRRGHLATRRAGRPRRRAQDRRQERRLVQLRRRAARAGAREREAVPARQSRPRRRDRERPARSDGTAADRSRPTRSGEADADEAAADAEAEATEN